jgi:VWFA-related protein
MAARLSATPARWTLVFGAMACLATAVVAGQQPAPQPQQPLFRAGVDLVTLDVRAVDKDGKPVPGLTKDDFVVTLDGQARPVVALDYQVFGGAPSVIQATTPTDSASNPPATTATASRGGRVLLLVIDDLSAQPLQMKGLLNSAEKMLATLDASDMVGIVTTSGLGPAVSPTRDRAAILAELRGKGLMGRADVKLSQPYVTVNEAFDIARPGGDPDTLPRVLARECGIAPSGSSRGGVRGGSPPDQVCPARVVADAKMLASLAEQTTADQVAAYLHAVTAMRSAPVPRTVIALTGGVAVRLGRADTLDLVSQAAADADVGFYGLIAIDDMDLGIDSSPDRAKARRDESAFMVAGMESLALTAGGEAHRVVGQADRFYNRIITEVSGLYRLGVEAPPGLQPNRYVSVKVSVKRSGVTVHTNTHAVQPSAVATATATPAAIGDALKLRLEQGGAAFGVPIRLATGLRKDTASARVQVLVTVDVPAATPGPLTTMFALMNGAGTIVSSGRTDVPMPANDDYRISMPVPVDAGEYRLRVAVADAKGNIGSVEKGVAARLQRIGPFTASDLLTTFSAADDAQHVLTLETLPPNATTLYASLELYAETFPPDVTVRVSVTPAGGAPLLDTELTPARLEGRLTTSAAIPVESLPAGRYVVAAAVLLNGQVVGTVTATVRKGP